jgi:Skp family chaperone for outer membrane proteins
MFYGQTNAQGGTKQVSKKHKIISSGIGSIVVFLAAWAIFAQDAPKSDPVPAGEYTKVAVIDVNKVFKENAVFNAEMTQLKSDADDMDKKMKEEEVNLRAKVSQLQGAAPGSAEYTEIERNLAQAQTDWKLRVQMKRREFLQREANAYLIAYQNIQTEIDKYAREHHINFVLRFTDDPVDSKNPESVLSYINKPIVQHDENLDITSDIIKILAEKQKPAPKEEKPESKEEKAS